MPTTNMPRYYAAVRLLEHGPLTRRQMREITGWPDGAVSDTLQSLRAADIISFTQPLGCRRPVYQLREGPSA